MSHKVDISEVHEFSDDLQGASEEIQSSLIKVKKGIENINGMSSFSGKAAKEAKQYFGELHLTILESFRGLFDDLEANLQQHIEKFGSDVDSSDSAIIKSSYLQEVKEDINEVFEDLEKQDEIIHDTIKEVSDISSATPPSFSDVDEWKKKAIKKFTELEEDLSSFNGVGDETNVKEIMHQIETVMSNAKTSEGKARFADFKGATRSGELAKLIDYNANKREERKDKLDSLKEKLKDGEDLSYTEREILYQHIQDEVLDEYDRAHMNEISIFMQYDNEKLKGHINEKVLSSEKSLEDEIILLVQYLFAGNERPGDLYGDTTDRVALRSYLDVLKNYHTAINEVKEGMDWDRNKNDPLLARVEDATFEFEGESKITPHSHMESDITIDLYQDTSEDKGISREEFLEVEMPLAVRRNHSEVETYYGGDAVTDRMHKEGNELEEKVDTMNGEFLGNQLLGVALSIPRQAVSAPLSGLKNLAQFQADKNEKKDRLSWKRIKETANKFNLEMQVNTRDVPGHAKNEQVQLNSSDETFEQIERWHAIHLEKPNFPYDGDAISKQDWNEMYKLFYDEDGNKKSHLNEEDMDLLNYMLNGTPSNNETVLKLWNRDR